MSPGGSRTSKSTPMSAMCTASPPCQIGSGAQHAGVLELVLIPVSDIDHAKTDDKVGEVQRFDWGSFVFFSDPDGNGSAVQQLPVRSWRICE
jgi:hypothetical protein